MNRMKEEMREEWEGIRKKLSEARIEREEGKEKIREIERRMKDLEKGDKREE